MLVYIWFRFEWQFALGAVAAVAHDVAATIGVFALLGLEFNLATVAAILLIVGYSMNDTVVVYDRVRENLRKYRRCRSSTCCRAASTTRSRAPVMTSVTTLLALLALWVLGGPRYPRFLLRDGLGRRRGDLFVGVHRFSAAHPFGLERLARGAVKENAAAGGERRD